MPCTDSKIAEIADSIRAASLCPHVTQNIHLLLKNVKAALSSVASKVVHFSHI